MGQVVFARSLTITPRSEWAGLFAPIKRFLFHPSDVGIDAVMVSLSGQYPRNVDPNRLGWRFDVSLAQLSDGELRRIHLDDERETFIRTDEPGIKQTFWFEPVLPLDPLFVLVRPNTIGSVTQVPEDFQIHVTVYLLVENVR